MVQLVDYLLSFPGVKANLVNNKGVSPLDIALHAESQDKPNFSKIVQNLNLLNNKGLSPLDIALHAVSQDKPNFGKIVEKLKDFGAKESLICQCRSELPPWKSQQTTNNIDIESKILDVDTLVASLIATVTFAAVFQVPGGTKDSGLSRMSLETVFHVFLFSDCLAFFASMTVVIAWIFRERLQTKLVADRSPLAKLSMLSLGISIVSTCLAFLCATILVTIPRKLDSLRKKDDKKEYRMIFTGEIVVTFLAPLLALGFLSLAWIFEYNFRATNERQARLKWALKRVLISTLPVTTVVLIIIFVYIIV